MEENLAKASQKNIDVWANNEMEYRYRLEDLEREMKTVQLSRISTENRALEQEVHKLMKRCQDKRVRKYCTGGAQENIFIYTKYSDRYVAANSVDPVHNTFFS